VTPVRVLCVTHRYPPDGIGGVERYVERLAASLLAHGDAAAVLTRTPLPRPARPALVEEPAPVPVYRLVGGKIRLDDFLQHEAHLDRLATIVLLRGWPDVVHVNHLLGHGPQLVAVARRLRIPVVVSLHDFHGCCPLVHLARRDGSPCDGPEGGRACASFCFSHERRPARWLDRAAYFERLLTTAARVLAPSDDVASVFRRFAPAARIAVEPLGIESSERAAAPPAGGPLRLAVLGTIAPHKGVDLVVEALRLARLPAVTLLLVGNVDDGRYLNSLKTAAEQVPGLTLESTGAYAREPAGLLAGVDAVIAASTVREAFPLAPREALAAGIPVVAAAHGGLAEVVEHGVNGIAFAAGSAADLSSALLRLAQDHALRERLRRGARDTVVPVFADHVARLRAIFAEVVDGEPAARDADAVAEVDSLYGRLLADGFARRY
jgi:glycosyltransferase involved in cell wall biosynthesis